MKKVTVVLPVFNGEATIARTLQSLTAQTFKDFEVIACIDGSNDRSEEIIKDILSNAGIDFTVLKNEKNLSLAPTMNRLFAAASGEYIAIAEQDDVYLPYRLEEQVKILDAKNNVGIVSGIADFFDFDKNTSSYSFPGLLVNGQQYPTGIENFKLNYIHQIKVVNSCMMIRRSMHVNNGLYFDRHYGNVSADWSYILRASLVTDFYGIHKTLVHLDRTPGRQNITSYKEQQHKSARELLRNFYFEYPHIVSKSMFREAMYNQYKNEIGVLKFSELIISLLFFRYPLSLLLNRIGEKVSMKLKGDKHK